MTVYCHKKNSLFLTLLKRKLCGNLNPNNWGCYSILRASKRFIPSKQALVDASNTFISLFALLKCLISFWCSYTLRFPCIYNTSSPWIQLKFDSKVVLHSNDKSLTTCLLILTFAIVIHFTLLKKLILDLLVSCCNLIVT